MVADGLPGRAAPSGRFIVVLEDGAETPADVASDHARRFGLGVGSVYRNAIRGYASSVPLDAVDALRADPNVAYVEPDVAVHVERRRKRRRRRRIDPIPIPTPPPAPPPSNQQLPWGVDRVDADESSTKAGDGVGSIANVNAYVIDTGIAAVPDLNLAGHVNLARDSAVNTDCHGHGTHIAGTIAAKDNDVGVVGVAPGAPVTGVRVLDCVGAGYASDVLSGVEWVTANAKRPAVANMSINGPVSDAIEDAIRRSVASGIVYAIAAGNTGSNSCLISPSRAGGGTNNGIITVAATDRSDNEPGFSNFGPCVDVWAPGVDIVSLTPSGSVATLFGTSMSAAHVAGGAALYLSTHPAASPTTVESALRSLAQPTATRSKDGAAIVREYVGTL